MHQQLWGYKVEWKSVSRGTGGKKVEYHWYRRVKQSVNGNVGLFFSYQINADCGCFVVFSFLRITNVPEVFLI